MKVVLENLTKKFPNRNKRIKEDVIAVNNFNVEIPDGKLIGLLGPSGCGKSTALNLLSGLLKPTSGKIFFGEEDVTALPAEHRGVGLVFQNYALYPHLTVLQNIMFPLQNFKGEKKLTKERNTVIFIVIALAIATIIIYAVRRLRRKESELAEYIETVRELRDTLDSIPKDMASSVGELYRDRFSELNELCDIYYDHSGSSRQKNLVFDKLNETIDAIKSDHKRLKELEAAVNRYRDNVMEQLREVPRLTERDLRIALYTFAGFSNRAISIFLDSDPVSISRYRYNLKQKIKNSGAEHSEQLLNALSDK